MMSAATEPPITEWDPTPILDERLLGGKPYPFTLVILNQPIHNIPLFLDLWRRATSRIAADGGANRVHAIREHLSAATTTTSSSSFPKLDFIVGDLDSLRPETRAWFQEQWSGYHADSGTGTIAEIDADADATERAKAVILLGGGQIVRSADQDSTDFAKAVKLARELGRRRRAQRPTASWWRRGEGGSGGVGKGIGVEENCEGGDVICYSGLGGRVDQAMSQLHHLYLFQRRRGRRRPKAPDEASVGEDNNGGGSSRNEDEGASVDEDEGGYANGRMYLTNGESLTFVLLAGQRHRIRIRPANSSSSSTSITFPPGDQHKKPTAFGKHVGIIPLAGPSELTTRGLEWDVAGWRTAFGERLSTSNHTTAGADVVEVEASRDVLFTIDVSCSSCEALI